MEGIYVYLCLIRVEVWQKTTKFCKAIILQLKKNEKKKHFRKQIPEVSKKQILNLLNASKDLHNI